MAAPFVEKALCDAWARLPQKRAFRAEVRATCAAADRDPAAYVPGPRAPGGTVEEPLVRMRVLMWQQPRGRLPGYHVLQAVFDYVHAFFPHTWRRVHGSSLPWRAGDRHDRDDGMPAALTAPRDLQEKAPVPRPTPPAWLHGGREKYSHGPLHHRPPLHAV